MADPVGSPQPTVTRRFKVGEIEIRPDTNTVVVSGEERYLRSQTMLVLIFLAERPGELVSKEALNRAIWNDFAVTDDALVQCVVEIRKALGDDPRRPRFIKTVPKGGYSFIGPVSEFLESPAPAPPAESHAEPAPFSRPWAQWTAAAIGTVVLVGGAIFAGWPRATTTQAIEWPAQPGKARVIVLAFENPSKETDLNWLQHGLPEMIVTGLARSSGLSLLAPSQLARLPEGDPGPGNLAAAIALAKRTKADAIIAGSFAAVGDALRVDARVHQADGTLIGSETLTAARREVVLAEIDRLAEGLSRVLGRPLNPQQSASHLSDVMTGDLSAYREYSLGVEKANALQSGAALEHFGAAVKADVNFAMAHARIGYTYAVTMGWPARGEPFLAKAFQLADRLREKDRVSILAWYALAKLDYEGALTPLRTLIDKYPDDIENYWLLSRTLRGEERWDEAESVILSGLRVNPNAKDLHNELRGLYGATWRLDLAQTEAEKYLALSPNEPNAHDSVGLVHQQAGRYEEALPYYQRAIELDPSFDIAVFHIANTYAEQGRYREAHAMYQRHADMMRFPEMRQRGMSAQGWLQFYRGNLDAAWRLMNAAPSEQAATRYDIAIVALARGDRRRFDEEMRKPLNASNRGARFPRMLVSHMQGLQARANQQPDAAIAAFREATRHAPMPWAFPTFDDGLAQALFDDGRLDDAAREYQRLLSHNPSAARYQYRLAQIADRQGRQADAAAAYRRFLALWPKADADVPEVVAARAWLARADRKTPTAD